jgi:hypothetical protein
MAVWFVSGGRIEKKMMKIPEKKTGIGEQNDK